MSGFYPIRADSVGSALAALLGRNGALFSGPSIAGSDEAEQVFDELGAIIDQFTSAGVHATLAFIEYYSGTEAVLSLDGLDQALYELIAELLASRHITMRFNAVSKTGDYTIAVHPAALFMGPTCVWTHS